MSALRRTLGRARRALARELLLAGAYSRRSWSWKASDGDEIAVVMCLWNRPSRIIPILTMLDGQKTSRPIRLYLWNNNRADHEHYVSALESFVPQGALAGTALAKSLVNVGSIGRFYWARPVARRNPSGYIVVLDDDQNILDDFIERAHDAGRADRVSAWWAWVVEGEYHTRRRATSADVVTHVGPGGSVVPVALVAARQFFTRIPDRFRMLDDLWLSYYARELGVSLHALPADIEFVMDETNQFHGQKDLKSEFFEYLYGDGADTRRPRVAR